MQKIEYAIEQATRGRPLLLVRLINQLLNQGYSVDRLAKFAERHYTIPRDVAEHAIVSVVIH